MSTAESSLFVEESLKRLDGSDTLSWPERREIASKLRGVLPTCAPTDSMLALASLLARDAKPEVRKEIAESLVHLPDDDFVKLASALSGDSNDFVRKAAERAIARRQRSADQGERTRRALDAVESQVSAFEGVYGPVATNAARKIADEQYAALVQQTHHDIRNILSPVKTSISSLMKQFEKGKPDEKFCKENLSEMARRLEYMERFLNDMKEYVKATSADRRRERLSDIVHEAQEIALASLRSAGTPVDSVNLSVAVPENLTVYAARHQLLMAIVHLVTNAYESFVMPPKRKGKQEVRIVVTQNDTSIQLSIADTGPGIHPEDLEWLRKFEPGKKSKKPNGTGFGLPTAFRYVVLQGGSFHLDSALNTGTSITIALPLEGEDEAE